MSAFVVKLEGILRFAQDDKTLLPELVDCMRFSIALRRTRKRQLRLPHSKGFAASTIGVLCCAAA